MKLFIINENESIIFLDLIEFNFLLNNNSKLLQNVRWICEIQLVLQWHKVSNDHTHRCLIVTRKICYRRRQSGNRCTFRGKLYGTNWPSRSTSRTHGFDIINSRSISLRFLLIFLPRLQLWHLDWLLCFQSVGNHLDSSKHVVVWLTWTRVMQRVFPRISNCEIITFTEDSVQVPVFELLSVSVSSQLILVLQLVSWAHTK